MIRTTLTSSHRAPFKCTICITLKNPTNRLFWNVRVRCVRLKWYIWVFFFKLCKLCIWRVPHGMGLGKYYSSFYIYFTSYKWVRNQIVQFLELSTIKRLIIVCQGPMCALKILSVTDLGFIWIILGDNKHSQFYHK